MSSSAASPAQTAGSTLANASSSCVARTGMTDRRLGSSDAQGFYASQPLSFLLPRAHQQRLTRVPGVELLSSRQTTVSCPSRRPARAKTITPTTTTAQRQRRLPRQHIRQPSPQHSLLHNKSTHATMKSIPCLHSNGTMPSPLFCRPSNQQPPHGPTHPSQKLRQARASRLIRQWAATAASATTA